MIIAIVPAAGKSQRMGQPKLLLPLGQQTVIEHVVTALCASPVDRVLVIAAPGADAIRALLCRTRADLVELAAPTPDMRASVEHGLAYAESRWDQASREAFLVAPADHPDISPAIVETLIERLRRSTRTVFLPTYRGRRGHPVLFAWKHAAAIRALPPDKGINHLVAAEADEIEECPVEQPELLEDLDTPEDYQRALRRWSGGKRPLAL